jgi:RNA polymerase sigma factor (TIGR02999 family)
VAHASHLQELDVCPSSPAGVQKSTSAELLPLVYSELRALAKARMAREAPGHTLQPTALVHQAYVRLVDSKSACVWDCRGHFFAAAAEAMHRIVVENARTKKSKRRGGDWRRLEFQEVVIQVTTSVDDILALGEAVELLSLDDTMAASVARLRLFTGFTIEETAMALELPQTTAYRHWVYARAFLQRRLNCQGL